MRILGHIKVSCTLAATSFFLGTYMGYEYDTVLTLSVMLAIGSFAPDIIELGIIEHRTYTHYHPYYTVIVIASWYAYQDEFIDEIAFLTSSPT